MHAEARQLEEMREAAFGLGMCFAAAAKVEADVDRQLRLSDAFLRSFTAVRLSIALAMRMEREALSSARPAQDRDAEERPQATSSSERPEREDERDRDRETASLPILLRTLEHVADDAQALTPQAAELPGLRELLDRVGVQPAASPTPVAPAGTGPAPKASSKGPSASAALKARLTGGAATLTLTPSAARPIGGLPGLAPPRRATGPPGR